MRRSRLHTKLLSSQHARVASFTGGRSCSFCRTSKPTVVRLPLHGSQMYAETVEGFRSQTSSSSTFISASSVQRCAITAESASTSCCTRTTSNCRSAATFKYASSYASYATNSITTPSTERAWNGTAIPASVPGMSPTSRLRVHAPRSEHVP